MTIKQFGRGPPDSFVGSLSSIKNQKSKIKNQKSICSRAPGFIRGVAFFNQKSKIKNQKSIWFRAPGFIRGVAFFNQKSKIKNQKSKIKNRLTDEAQGLDHGSIVAFFFCNWYE